MKTGWPPGLLQDDDRGLSRWFASRPDARYQLRKNIMDKQPEAMRLADALEEKEYPPRRAAAAELRRLHQSEREGWRYANELEQERKRLTALNVQLLEALERIDGIRNLQDAQVLARATIAAAKGEA